MTGNSRVAVFKKQIDRPLYHVKFKVAKQLVDRGRAEFIEADKAIRLICIEPIVASSILLSCGQGDTYEKAAIEKNLQYLHGGLNRTEHQPAPFNRWKGARVGHQ